MLFRSERVLQREEISHSRPTRIRNDHHLGTGIPRPSDRGKRVDDDRALLHEILRMKVFVLDDRFRRLTDWNLRIILRRFDDLITRLVGRVVGKHIVDKALLLGFPCGSADKESACSAGDLGLIPGSGMTTHSSILAWRIPRTEETRGLQSMASQRVRHD